LQVSLNPGPACLIAGIVCRQNQKQGLSGKTAEAEFFKEIQTKVLIVFLLAIHLTSFALKFLFLQTHETFYSFYSSVTVHCKGVKGGKPDRKTYLHPYGLRNPYINLKSENSQD
jgi:hypothetical protein